MNFEILNEFKTAISVERDQRQGIDSRHIVFNSSRPLFGNKTWEGDFLHGRFYAAVDLCDSDADWMIKSNSELDAWIYFDMKFSEIKHIVSNYALTMFSGNPEKAKAAVERLTDRQHIEQFRVILKRYNYGELKKLMKDEPVF